jgi:hypothetical protein
MRSSAFFLTATGFTALFLAMIVAGVTLAGSKPALPQMNLLAG